MVCALAGNKSTVLLAEFGKSEVVPPKFAVSGYDPVATFGVIEQVAVPVTSVVPVQVWPAKEKLKVTPATPAIGEAEVFMSVAESTNALFKAPLLGLRFRVRNVLCLPGVHVTCASFEKMVELATSADAKA